MKNFFMTMLSDGSTVSVKRVITFSAFILLAIAFLLDLAFDVKVADKLVDVMEMLVVAGFTGTVAEKFAKKSVINTPPTDESTNS